MNIFDNKKTAHLFMKILHSLPVKVGAKFSADVHKFFVEKNVSDKQYDTFKITKEDLKVIYKLHG